jgi:hypothetical protein
MREEFERFEERIAETLEYAGNTHTTEDIWREIEAGDVQMWPGSTSIILTHIIQSPQRRDLHFFVAAGEMEELMRTYPIVLAWGKEMGCSRATFTGRKGWERSPLVRTDGWKPTLVHFEREL